MVREIFWVHAFGYDRPWDVEMRLGPLLPSFPARSVVIGGNVEGCRVSRYMCDLSREQVGGVLPVEKEQLGESFPEAEA